MCNTEIKSNQRIIKVYGKKDKYLGFETVDVRFNRHDILKLLNSKYPWIWEYYS